MYNAAKFIKATALAATVALTMGACSKDNSRQMEAQALLEKAQAYKQAHDYTAALASLDSLDKNYRECLDERRTSTRLRMETLLSLTVDSIEADEQRRPILQAKLDSLQPLFMNVSMTGTEGFKVAKADFNSGVLNGNCVQPRLDEKNYFYVVANVVGRRIKLDELRYGDLTARGASVSMEGSEMMSLPQESVADIAAAVAATTDKTVTFELAGPGGKVNVKLNAKQLEAWRLTWEYAQVSQQMNLANIRREKYERQVAQLTEQLDATPVVETESKE